MNLEELFLSLGYNLEEYELIINAHPFNYTSNEIFYNNVKTNYNFLLSLGFNNDEIIKLTLNKPQLFSYSIANMSKKIDDLINLGYQKNDIVKIIKVYPSIFSLDINYIIQKIKSIMELGYKKDEVFKITKKLPSILGLDIDKLKHNMELLNNLGYSMNEAINMTVKAPSILTYSDTKITNRIKELMALGYSREDVIKMTVALPTLFDLTIETIKEKVEYYNSINLHELTLKEPKQLMQSTKLSYARYMFYKNRDVVIDMTNYKKLFLGEKQFIKQYNVTNEEIITIYDFNKYKEKQNARAI